MAHFAKISEDNRVLHVEVVDNNILLDESNIEQENLGVTFLTQTFGWPNWVQTSYNTYKGKYLNADGTEATDQSKALRKNFAAIGYTWDATRNAFYAPQPYNSWILNEDTCQWEAPVAKPNDGQEYIWDEVNQTWILED
tara:strand:+ start:1151 stop:1567 length:417 start_codon:yes stop_codon:yes gene_type:complete